MNKIKENFYFLKTFGCQMSNLDSKYIQLLLNKMSFETKQIEKADIIIFNTCSIREASENKLLNLFSYISKMKEYNKDIFVAVLGCFVEKINYKFIQKHSYIDCFISPDYLHFLPYAFKRFHLKSAQARFGKELPRSSRRRMGKRLAPGPVHDARHWAAHHHPDRPFKVSKANWGDCLGSNFRADRPTAGEIRSCLFFDR